MQFDLSEKIYKKKLLSVQQSQQLNMCIMQYSVQRQVSKQPKTV